MSSVQAPRESPARASVLVLQALLDPLDRGARALEGLHGSGGREQCVQEEACRKNGRSSDRPAASERDGECAFESSNWGVSTSISHRLPGERARLGTIELLAHSIV